MYAGLAGLYAGLAGLYECGLFGLNLETLVDFCSGEVGLKDGDTGEKPGDVAPPTYLGDWGENDGEAGEYPGDVEPPKPGDEYAGVPGLNAGLAAGEVESYSEDPRFGVPGV
jgi:hypothetical protein